MQSLPSQRPTLQVWWDATPRSAAEHLAVDEALLRSIELPTVRFYQWQGDAFTLGYFLRWQEFRDAIASRTPGNVARRWTGGGLVDHRGDSPYTIVAPAGSEWAAASAAVSYRQLHTCLATALRENLALDVRAEASAPLVAGANERICFEAPVNWDVVDASDGRKIAGAAQRRSHGRLLHQGSVMLPAGATQGESGSNGSASPPPWQRAFCRDMATSLDSRGSVVEWSPSDETLAEADRIAAERYATQDWLRRF